MATARKLTFTAWPADDAFDVTYRTFEEIMGREPDQGGKDDGVRPGTYRVMLGDLAAVFRGRKLVEVSLSVMEA